MERSVHDALCVVKRVMESSSIVCGGGAVEAALSVYLESFATSLVSENNILMEYHSHPNGRVFKDVSSYLLSLDSH